MGAELRGGNPVPFWFGLGEWAEGRRQRRGERIIQKSLRPTGTELEGRSLEAKEFGDQESASFIRSSKEGQFFSCKGV